jgi:diacylglycerol kinase (ATP)
MRNKFLGTGERGYHPVRKIRVALRGLYYAILFDAAVTYKTVLSCVLLIVFFRYRQWLDVGLVLVATGVMIVSEIFNTTVEALCDFIESDENKKIGMIKDIAAAGAGVSIFVWCIVIVIELFRANEVFLP